MPGEDVPDVVDGQGGEGVLAGVEAERGCAGKHEHHLDVGRLALVELGNLKYSF